MNRPIVITRHTALVAYLREIGLIDEDTPILPHVTDPEEVRGHVVIGPCPLHLADVAASVVQIPLRLEPEDRGRELTLEEVRAHAGDPVEYKVESTNYGFLRQRAVILKLEEYAAEDRAEASARTTTIWMETETSYPAFRGSDGRLHACFSEEEAILRSLEEAHR